MDNEWIGLHWRDLRNNTSVRARLIADAGLPTTLPPIYGTNPAYMLVKYGMKLNKALDLNANYTLLGSEKNLNNFAKSLYKEKKAFIIQSYTPSFDLAIFDLETMTLPSNPSGLTSDPCFLEARCDCFDDLLVAVVHNKMKDELPEVLSFLKSMDLDRTAVNEIIGIYSETHDD